MLFAFIFGFFSNSFSRETSPAFDWLKIRPSDSFEKFDWSVLPDGISREMVLSLISHPNISSDDPMTILPYNNLFIALLPCRFDVLLWSGDKWSNLYKGNSSGFNCKADFFFQNGILFSYGKYGFWRAHSEIIYFDFETGFWQNLPAKNPPINYGGVASFKSQNKLLTMMGQNIHQSSGLDEFEKDGFYFDFDKNSWFPLKIEIPNKPKDNNWMIPSFDLKDFGIHLYKYEAELGVLLIDKKDLRLLFSRKDYTPIGAFFISYSKGNQVWFFDEKADSNFLDLEKDLVAHFQKIGSVTLLKSRNESTNRTFENLALSLFSLILIGGLGFLFYRKIKSRSKIIPNEELTSFNGTSEEPNGEIYSAIDRLIEFENQLIDVERLDQILGLVNIENQDYRKVKRSRLIKAINESYLSRFDKHLIERTKSELDKRIILYKISP